MRPLVFLTLALLAPLPVIAQSRSRTIQLGSTKLTLGAPQDAVIARLIEEYDLQTMNPTSWLVRSKGPAPYTWYGSVTFKNHKLAVVRKSWSPPNQEKGFEFANALYGAAAALVADGRTNCTLTVEQQQQPTGETRHIRLYCGPDRSIEIAVIKTSDQTAATLDEAYRATP